MTRKARLTDGRKAALQDLVATKIRWDCPLAGYTSYNIGGPADGVIELCTLRELQTVLAWISENSLPWHVIGRGTNLLVSDDGFRGLIFILTGDFLTMARLGGSAGRIRIRSGAGVKLTRLVNQCVDWGGAGIEFAHGIPGSLGGAVMMNAGAWGGDIGQNLSEVEITTSEGARVLSEDQLKFGYRKFSGFEDFHMRGVITGATLVLEEADPENIRIRCRELARRRREKQAVKQPNCGSFFKNPESDSAGRLIEEAGLKGFSIGGAMVSREHANFLVNTGAATAMDVRNLMEHVQAEVHQKFRVLLETEVHFL